MSDIVTEISTVVAKKVGIPQDKAKQSVVVAVSYTHLRAHETVLDLVCRLLLEKTNTKETKHYYTENNIPYKVDTCHKKTLSIHNQHTSSADKDT